MKHPFKPSSCRAQPGDAGHNLAKQGITRQKPGTTGQCSLVLYAGHNSKVCICRSWVISRMAEHRGGSTGR